MFRFILLSLLAFTSLGCAPDFPTVAKFVSRITAPNKTTTVQFKKPFPQTIEVTEGDDILFYAFFTKDPGLFDPFAFPRAETTDGLPDPVLSEESGIKRLDRDTIQVRRFVALRAGEAVIVIESVRGKETIRVTVKPKP